jgi:hypothetical protein
MTRKSVAVAIVVAEALGALSKIRSQKAVGRSHEARYRKASIDRG